MPDPLDTSAPRRRTDEDAEFRPAPPPPIEARSIRIDDGSLSDLFERLPKTPSLSPSAFASDPPPPPPDECADAKPTLVRASDLPKHATVTAGEIASRTGADATLLESSRQAICAQTGTDPFKFADKNEAGREWRRAPEMTHDEQLQATLRMIGSMRDNPLASMAYLYARVNDESLAQQEATVGVADVAWGVLGGVGAAKAASVEPRHPLAEEPLRDGGGSLPKVNGRNLINKKYAWGSFPAEKMPPAVAAKYPAGVRMKANGFPDFSPYAIRTVEVSNLVGKRIDLRRASEAANLPPVERPIEDHTWHHHEDGRRMLLVPDALHDAVRHTGGAAIQRERVKRSEAKW